MTVSDLTPLHVFGLVVLANAFCYFLHHAYEEVYPRLQTWKERSVFWAGVFCAIGLPAILGLMALQA